MCIWENFAPHYAWFDGQMQYTTIDTRFDPAGGPVEVNGFNGSPDDPKSRIWPFKQMHTIQPYDKGNNTLVYMHLWRVARFYTWGIFKGEHHPYRKAYWRKHNPLQALAYLALKLFLFPAIWISGIFYLLYTFWGTAASGDALTWVALVHTAVAFAILAFVIIHIYLLTTGHSFKEHVMPMINGFDEVDLSPEEAAYLEKDQPGQIR